MTFHIAGRPVGPAHRPLIIAEIGINHGGSLAIAREMVDAAASHGAECIKHQTHIIDDEMCHAARSQIPGNTDKSIYQIMVENSLNEAEEFELQAYVQSRGLIFLSTPFSRKAVDRLERMEVPAYKIGSGECSNYPLLHAIARLGKPVILSTGMNDLEMVKKSVTILRQYRVPYALLHCTNLYPTPPELVRLGALNELQSAFSDAVIGLSDHSTSNYPSLGAVALGASIIERHFTDSMSREGPDIVCSMDPKALSELIEGSDIIFQARGGSKDLRPEEQVTRDFAFASVVSIAPIRRGEKFTRENLWVKRPGTGHFDAEKYDAILDQTAARDIPGDRMLEPADILGTVAGEPHP
ncbi:MAG: polyhydroxyalkanoate biosynthesis repressor PhaR [Gammaproteobacteria bacterium]|nr:polyhydroxyalkanoate biosynthesis repressor PhaR [Gammaproteobacteria bacterium]